MIIEQDHVTYTDVLTVRSTDKKLTIDVRTIYVSESEGNDSAVISLNEAEVKQLVEELNRWLNENRTEIQ